MFHRDLVLTILIVLCSSISWAQANEQVRLVLLADTQEQAREILAEFEIQRARFELSQELAPVTPLIVKEHSELGLLGLRADDLPCLAVVTFQSGGMKEIAGSPPALVRNRQGGDLEWECRQILAHWVIVKELQAPQGWADWGFVLFEHGDREQAVRYYRKAAEAGNRLGQCQLGRMYELGLVVERDFSQALRYYNQAAAQEHPTGLYRLGCLYERGRGVAVDFDKAFQLFQRSVEAGSDYGHYGLARCYYRGKGVPEDVAGKALHHAELAAAAGINNARTLAGICYFYGKTGTAGDLQMVAHFRDAADEGSSRAVLFLGLCHLYGRGVERDLDKAERLIRKAQAQGDAGAQKFLELVEQTRALEGAEQPR